jgi:hypothetical protein
MKKPLKLLLGIATLWPFAYLVLFFVAIFSTIFFVPGSEGQTGAPPLIALILPLHLLTMIAIMALMVFYIVNVFRNDRVEKDKKALWAVVLFMGNMIAMPIYWYLYIWKAEAVAATLNRAQLRSADSFASTPDVKVARSEEQYVPPAQPPNWRE